MVILGLDASTTCVGYAFTKDKKILDMGFIDIKKEKTPKDKVQKVLEKLNESSYIDEVNDINVEDNLSGFAGGRTSQQVIIKLAKFNTILCFMLEEMFEFNVHSINPMTARKNVFGKARVKGKKAKQFVQEEIEKCTTHLNGVKKLHEEIGIKEISICMMVWLCHFLKINKKKLDLYTKKVVTY